MASIYFKGSKSAPRWFVRFVDSDGSTRSKRVRVETRKEAMQIARHEEAAATLRSYGIGVKAPPAMSMRELLEKFTLSLDNRSYRDDETRIRLHVAPYWGAFTIDQVTTGAIIRWLDQMRGAAKIAPGTQRHALAMLSRCFSWALARELATTNPCRNVPSSDRPTATPAKDDQEQWISDDETPVRIMERLPAPFDLVFYVCFTSGCRVSEALGLRLGDLDEIASGSIRIAHSGDGFLKEDRRGIGKTKLVPIGADAVDVLGPLLTERRAAGAGPDDLVFAGSDGKLIPRYVLAHQWDRVRKELGITMSWHRATRTSACSRWASRGVPIDQIASALGHASTAVTARSYQKWRRKTFDPRMTASFTAPAPEGGNVTRIGSARPAAAPEAAIPSENAGSIRPTATAGEHAVA
ncbi:MAG TPA: tyrosine-type recombinase/integrase [Polyangia bacterium]|jgi:integrase|nr:tyrosine-type recombinase/integrase [Polyangia bacterium]